MTAWELDRSRGLSALSPESCGACMGRPVLVGPGSGSTSTPGATTLWDSFTGVKGGLMIKIRALFSLLIKSINSNMISKHFSRANFGLSG